MEKNPAGYFKLENWKNPVQIDRRIVPSFKLPGERELPDNFLTTKSLRNSLNSEIIENIVFGQNLTIPAIVDNSRCDFSQVRSTLR